MEELIPSEWFTDLRWWALLGIVAVSMYCLMTGADWLVDGASGLARRLRIPKIIIGATIVSLGTTAPECAVSVMAAWGGKPGLALGNAVGSIIADTGLIFGLGCMLVALPVNRFLLSRQGWVQFGSAVLLAGLCYGMWQRHGDEAHLPRWVGGLFLLLLGAYMIVSILWSRRIEALSQTGDGPNQAGANDREAHTRRAARLLGLVIVGVVVVVLSSHVLIESVTVLARRMLVPQVVIAATLVAFGTSLPELVVGMMAIRRGHPDLLVGNVIGADVLNVLFVIGASAIARPLPIIEPGTRFPEIFLYVHLPTMLLILVLFRVFIVRAVRRNTFERWMGAPLVLLWLGYVILQFVVASGAVA